MADQKVVDQLTVKQNVPKSGFLGKLLHGIAGAFTTPAAVKAEKSLAAVVVARLVISVGGTAAFADLIVQLIQKA